MNEAIVKRCNGYCKEFFRDKTFFNEDYSYDDAILLTFSYFKDKNKRFN
jgi:hypothetical protein